jgi:hypothetical protein
VPAQWLTKQEEPLAPEINPPDGGQQEQLAEHTKVWQHQHEHRKGSDSRL